MIQIFSIIYIPKCLVFLLKFNDSLLASANINTLNDTYVYLTVIWGTNKSRFSFMYWRLTYSDESKYTVLNYQFAIDFCAKISCNKA